MKFGIRTPGKRQRSLVKKLNLYLRHYGMRGYNLGPYICKKWGVTKNTLALLSAKQLTGVISDIVDEAANFGLKKPYIPRQIVG